jgi:RHS repeat-associated protein
LTASADGNVIADAIRLVGTGPAPADLVYLHTDQIGLPQKITDATRAVVWDRVQDPFGRQVSLANSGGIETSLRFPGQQADPDTGFAYNYFRDYDPTLGRYIQADPIGLAGGINRYAYVEGNPVRSTDRLGLDSESQDAARTYIYRQGPLDVFVPGTPANDYWTKWISRELRHLYSNIERFCASVSGSDAEAREKQCEAQAEQDEAVCRSLSDPSARARCWESANARFGACSQNKPLPPLITW